MVTKVYFNYIGNSSNGSDTGDELARFADYYSTENGYKIKRKASHNDFERTVSITGSQKQWDVIEKDCSLINA